MGWDYCFKKKKKKKKKKKINQPTSNPLYHGKVITMKEITVNIKICIGERIQFC